MLKIATAAHTVNWFFAVALASLLAACGGDEGGHENSDPGAGLSLNTNAIGFSAVQNGSTPSPQQIQITITDPNTYSLVVGVPVGSALPSWLSLSVSGTGSVRTLMLSILSTGLAPGTYTATVRILIARSDNAVIGYQDAAVTYIVTM